MSSKKFIPFVFLAAFMLIPHLLFGNPERALKIEVPPGAKIEAPGAHVELKEIKGETVLFWSKKPSFPFVLRVTGILGGIVEKSISHWGDLKPFIIKNGIITPKDPNPMTIPHLPTLCPRVTVAEGRGVYDGSKDRLNHIPVLQLLEPDANSRFAENPNLKEKVPFVADDDTTKISPFYQSYSQMDGKNVLLLKEVEIHYDYEDSKIIDYVGPDPISGKEVVINEGNGGFYANIHYAILPYNRVVLKLDRQTLLHLAQGKLKEINKEDLSPSFKVHSFIPGPFLSQEGHFYNMCEWGDTDYQAPVQKMAYEDMALWDWDYSTRDADHLLLIVWEGDEEDWMIEQKLINPFYLTDDLIGIFEIKKKKTKKPLTLVNEKGDFKITVETGNLNTPP